MPMKKIVIRLILLAVVAAALVLGYGAVPVHAAAAEPRLPPPKFARATWSSAPLRAVNCAPSARRR